MLGSLYYIFTIIYGFYGSIIIRKSMDDDYITVHKRHSGQNALITNASCIIIYELKSIHHNESRRSRIQWDVIVFVYPSIAIRRRIG